MKKAIDAYMVVDKNGKPVYDIDGSIYASKKKAGKYIVRKWGEYVVAVKITVVGPVKR